MRQVHAVQQMQGLVKPTMQLQDGVRVNNDKGLEHEADVMGAKAFTKGQDVFFRQGAFYPGSWWGQDLIAHELTHFMQQCCRAIPLCHLSNIPGKLPPKPHQRNMVQMLRRMSFDRIFRSF
jgi:hypothetical protein